MQTKHLFAGFAAMALTASMASSVWAVAPSRQSEGLPSLDAAIFTGSSFSGSSSADAGMTPVSDMTAGHGAITPAVATDADDVPAVRMKLTPWTDLMNDDVPTAASNAKKKQPVSSNTVNPVAMAAVTTAAVATSAVTTPAQPDMAMKPAVSPEAAMPSVDAQTPVSMQSATPAADKAHKPGKIAYTALPAVAIFPVIRHGNETAFGDLPVLFSREFSMKLEGKTPGTRVYNPVYTVDELRARGLGHIYDQVMDYYRTAGRPEPAALDYLIEQLNTGSDTPIARVMFVEADLDTSHPAANTGVWEHFKGVMVDGLPEHQKYIVHSRVQVFNAEDPAYPMIWAYNASRPVSADDTYNVTPSVFADGDSEMSFARISRELSGEMMIAMPKTVYLEPHVDTGVTGEVVSQNSDNILQRGLQRGAHAVNTLTQQDRNALHRILNRE